jgi:hypothetical protein
MTGVVEDEGRFLKSDVTKPDNSSDNKPDQNNNNNNRDERKQ